MAKKDRFDLILEGVGGVGTPLNVPPDTPLHLPLDGEDAVSPEGEIFGGDRFDLILERVGGGDSRSLSLSGNGGGAAVSVEDDVGFGDVAGPSIRRGVEELAQMPSSILRMIPSVVQQGVTGPVTMFETLKEGVFENIPPQELPRRFFDNYRANSERIAGHPLFRKFEKHYIEEAEHLESQSFFSKESKVLPGRFARPPEKITEYVTDVKRIPTALQHLPRMAAFVGATLANPAAGMLLMFAAEGGESQKAVDAFEKETGTEVDPTIKYVVPIAVGSINAALEKVGVDRILKVGGGPLRQRVFKGILSAIVEGGTEGLQEIVQVMGAMGYDEYADVGLWERVAESVYQGVLMGAGGATPGIVFGKDRLRKGEVPERVPPDVEVGPVPAVPAEEQAVPAEEQVVPLEDLENKDYADWWRRQFDEVHSVRQSEVGRQFVLKRLEQMEKEGVLDLPEMAKKEFKEARKPLVEIKAGVKRAKGEARRIKIDTAAGEVLGGLPGPEGIGFEMDRIAPEGDLPTVNVRQWVRQNGGFKTSGHDLAGEVRRMPLGLKNNKTGKTPDAMAELFIEQFPYLQIKGTRDFLRLVSRDERVPVVDVGGGSGVGGGPARPGTPSDFPQRAVEKPVPLVKGDEGPSAVEQIRRKNVVMMRGGNDPSARVGEFVIMVDGKGRIHEGVVAAVSRAGNYRLKSGRWVVDPKARIDDAVWPPVKVRAVPGRGKGEAKFREEPKAEPFYSKLVRVVEDKLNEMPDRALAVKKWLSRRGVKQEEMDWIGVSDWLKENQKDGNIDRQAFLDFVRENQIEVQEVVKREVKDKGKRVFAFGSLPGDWFIQKINDEKWVIKDGDGKFISEGGNEQEAWTNARDYAYDNFLMEVEDVYEHGVLFSDFQEPGGKNYRELLLILSNKTGMDTYEENFQLYMKKFYPDLSDVDILKRYETHGEKYQEWYEKRFPVNRSFQSRHFAEPDILAHVRFNDRFVRGKKVLFLEEIQSDWHQLGKLKGYTGARASELRGMIAKLKSEIRASNEFIENENEIDKIENSSLFKDAMKKIRDFRSEAGYSPVDTGEIEDKYIDVVKMNSKLIDNRNNFLNTEELINLNKQLEIEEEKVPDAPFKKGWHELALKRMMRWAVENGYDRVAWTTGKMQVDRYDLSKHFQEIVYGKTVGVEDSYDLEGVLINGEKHSFGTIESKDLSNFVGKELAQNIVDGEGEFQENRVVGSKKGVNVLSGLDLRVGGEGMKVFYDQKIPGFFKRFGKQFGAGVESVDIEFGKKPSVSVQSIPVTDKMREGVAGGVPLFRAIKSGDVRRALESGDVGVRDEILKLNRRIFGDDRVAFVASIPGRLSKVGKYEKGFIDIVEGRGNPKDTFLHEAVHKAETEFLTDEELKVLEEAEPDAEVRAERIIEYFNSGKGFTGRVKVVVDRLVRIVRGLYARLKGTDVRGVDRLAELYDRILGGEFVGEVSRFEPLIAFREKGRAGTPSDFPQRAGEKPVPLVKVDKGPVRIKIEKGIMRARDVVREFGPVRKFLEFYEPAKNVLYRFGREGRSLVADITGTFAHYPGMRVSKMRKTMVGKFNKSFERFESWWDDVFGKEDMHDFMLTRGKRGKSVTPQGQQRMDDAGDRLSEKIKTLKDDRIPNAIRATYTAMQNLSDRIYRDVDKVFKELKRAGGLSEDEVAEMHVNYVDSYFRGTYEPNNAYEKFLEDFRKEQSRFYRSSKSYLNPKKFLTYADANALYGLRLREPNPIRNLLNELGAVSRLRSNLWLRERLMDSGKDRYIMKSVMDESPVGGLTYGQFVKSLGGLKGLLSAVSMKDVPTAYRNRTGLTPDEMVRALNELRPDLNIKSWDDLHKRIKSRSKVPWTEEQLSKIQRGIPPEGWIPIGDPRSNDPVWKGIWADPVLAKLINNMISTNAVTRTKGWKQIWKYNNAMRVIKMVASLHHARVVTEQALADSNILDRSEIPKNWRDVRRLIKSSRDGMEALLGDEKSAAEYWDYVRIGGTEINGKENYEHELQAVEWMREVFERLGKMRLFRNPVGKAVIGGPKIVTHGFNQWLFKHYIPMLKYVKFLGNVNKMELKKERSLTDAEKQEIVKEGNNFYGEMNERLFGRSGTMTTALRLIWMFPGYSEGNFRTMYKSLAQWERGGPGARSRYNILNSLILHGILATLGTAALTGRWPEKPEKWEDVRDLFKINTGLKDQKGNDIYIDLLSYDKDYWNVYGKLIFGPREDIVEDVIKRYGGMKSNAFQLIHDLSSVMMGKAITDWKGDAVYHFSDPFMIRIGKFLKHEWDTMKPISLSVAERTKRRGLNSIQAALVALAGTKLDYSEKRRRERKLTGELWDFKEKRADRLRDLRTIRNPVVYVEKFNREVDKLAENRFLTPELRNEVLSQRIDLDYYIGSKINRLRRMGLSDSDRRKILELLNNLSVTRGDHERFLKLYHQKLIERRLKKSRRVSVVAKRGGGKAKVRVRKAKTRKAKVIKVRKVR